MKGLGAIVMAAGLGKRMRSKLAKVLHPVAGRPMVLYAVDLAERIADEGIAVVVGHQADKVRAILEAHQATKPEAAASRGAAKRAKGMTAHVSNSGFRAPSVLIADQAQQLGTGHAVMQARAAFLRARGAAAPIYIILNGDTPLLTESTVQELLRTHETEKATVTILTAVLDDPSGYGRIVRAGDGRVPREGARPPGKRAGLGQLGAGRVTQWLGAGGWNNPESLSRQAQGGRVQRRLERAGEMSKERVLAHLGRAGEAEESYRDRPVLRIVEDRDATGAQSALREINVGTYVVDGPFLFDALDTLQPQNAQQEYYLTDIVKLAVERGLKVAALIAKNADEVMGINSRQQLADAERVMRKRICEHWMEQGVTLRDPATASIDADVRIGQDSVLHPHVTLEGRTRIGQDCVIRSHCRITDSVLGDRVVVQDCCVVREARLEDDSMVGPFAHLRPGAIIRRAAKVGNFVEMKKADLGEGSKANHLTYLGDTKIGKGVNIGAGTITCNYDGFHKFDTVIEDDVFIGSDAQLIAPVRIGRGAVVAAGSSVTSDVPADALAIARAVQVNREGWAVRRRALLTTGGETQTTDIRREANTMASSSSPRAKGSAAKQRKAGR
jgi:bifunctional N-acetylglucosamine-1-phosphate-uridyltransferase/glucosamine-1-phosphate-acetyltransferase GlmU-like protein